MNLYDDPVLLTEVAMLSALLFAGLYLSHLDFETRRVPNRYVLGLVLAGVAGQVLMVHLEVVTAGRVLANAGTALVIAGALLWFHLWASGDAKFFFAAVVALPPFLSARTEALSLQATPWALLLNVLACYLLVLLLLPLCRRLWGWPGALEPPGMREAAKAAVPVHRLEVAAPKRGEGLVCDEGKPLTGKQVSRLRSLVAGGHQSAEDLVEVEETIPFVPVIAMAAVLTACFAGNLVPPLVRLIDWLSS